MAMMGVSIGSRLASSKSLAMFYDLYSSTELDELWQWLIIIIVIINEYQRTTLLTDIRFLASVSLMFMQENPRSHSADDTGSSWTRRNSEDNDSVTPMILVLFCCLTGASFCTSYSSERLYRRRILSWTVCVCMCVCLCMVVNCSSTRTNEFNNLSFVFHFTARWTGRRHCNALLPKCETIVRLQRVFCS